MNRDAVVGTLLGTAVGDALGLPYEGLSAEPISVPSDPSNRSATKAARITRIVRSSNPDAK